MGKNKYYSGPSSDHFDGERFFNPSGTKPKGFKQLLKWQLNSESAKWPATFPSPYHDHPPAHVDDGSLRVSFLGHASYLIQGAGLAILIDPVFSERASPTQFVGPKRTNPPGVAFSALPKIDLVLVTHNHYDHMDMRALGALWRRFHPRFITPLGNDTILRKGIGGIDVVAVDWHQATDVSSDVRVDTVPTQHWSARGVGDRMHALWASFVLKVGRHTIYAVGDSGFGDGSIFRGVRERHSNIDLALLPIGAYEPRWFMRDQHMNPDDAVKAFQLCGARRALGHHWGTFQLTNEAIDAPRIALSVALAEHDIAEPRFIAAQPGLVVTI